MIEQFSDKELLQLRHELLMLDNARKPINRNALTTHLRKKLEQEFVNGKCMHNAIQCILKNTFHVGAKGILDSKYSDEYLETYKEILEIVKKHYKGE